MNACLLHILLQSVNFFIGWHAPQYWDSPFLVFFNIINWSTGIFMLVLCLSKKVNRKLLKSCVKEKVEEYDSRRTVSTQVSTREEGYELTSSNDQLIQSPSSGSSNLAYEACPCPGISMWGYQNHNGPDRWEEWFPISASGECQSPIEIQESHCIQEPSLPPLQCEYKPEVSRTILNNGHGWKVMADPDMSRLSGGPLSGEYRLVQYQAHWGSGDGEGSEHVLDGERYDAELHLVHCNTKYRSLYQALQRPDGLAIIAVLLKLGRQHQEFSKLCIILNHVQRKGLQRDISALNLSPDMFLPVNKSYFTYAGSLTTPPLSECVTWLVFREPVEISRWQLAEMRRLNISSPEEEESRILANCRPPQPVGERRVVVYNQEV